MIEREQALDTLWAMMMLSLPLGPERENTSEERREAAVTFAMFIEAMDAFGVTVEEMEAAQRRYQVLLDESRA